jgi:hypothetical protein
MRRLALACFTSLLFSSSALAQPVLEPAQPAQEPAQPTQELARPALEPAQPAQGPTQRAQALAQPVQEPSALSSAPPVPRQKPTRYETVPPFSKLQLKAEGPYGTSIRFGTLTQVQYEAAGNFAEHDTAQNFFLRRTMLLLGGTILHDLEYFIDTDFVDLLKAAGDQSTKNGPGISLKDVFITYAGFGDVFKVDAGLMLPPLSHSALQGAPFLYGLDFFLNTYRHQNVFGTAANSFGRDAGLQLRGLVFGSHLEYRAGVFQGKRQAPEGTHPGARNPFRVAGRVQINLLDPETGYFYRGTYLGEKRLASIGGSFDVQPSDDGTYRAFAADAIWDIEGITGQFNYVFRDGGGLVALPKQSAVSAEAGYLVRFLRSSFIVRGERRWGPGPAIDETDFGGGIAFWAFNHTSNFKAFYLRGKRSAGARDTDQFVAQWQLAFF